MTLLAFVGCETGDLTEFVTLGSGGSVSASTTQAFTGTYSMRLNPTTSALAWAGRRVAAGQVRYAAWRMYIATMPASLSEEIFEFQTTTTGQAFLRLRSDGKLEVFKGNGTTTAATGTKVLVVNTWYALELSYDAGSGSTKDVVVKVNGVADITTSWSEVSGQATDAYWGKELNRNGIGYDIYFDDIIVADAAIGLRYAPDTLAASTNLTGTVATVIDPVDIPGATWLTATSAVAGTDARFTFKTPP